MMRLSLSVRIAEGFLSKEVPIIPLEAVAHIARAAGYSAVCMRASQVGIQSPPTAIQQANRILHAEPLCVSMVTGNFDIVYNNSLGPQALREIAPHLRLAQALAAPLIRVALKSDEDIPWAQRAADEAAAHGLRLAHQCHVQSLFETLDEIESTLRRIDRPNFGLIFEPANLQQCGQPYDRGAIERLAPWIFNVYLQNQRLHAGGSVRLETWCRGAVALDVVPIHVAGSLDFAAVMARLEAIDYQGFVTVHQSAVEGESPAQSAERTARYLRQLAEFE